MKVKAIAVMALTAMALTLISCNSKKAVTTVVKKTSSVTSSQAVKLKNTTVVVSKLKGYTAYVIKYVGKSGKVIKMNNNASLMKNGDQVYLSIDDAKGSSMFKDFYNYDKAYYFQLKVGSLFSWKITPTDTSSIKNWTADKANASISLNPDSSTDDKIVQYTVVVDYSTKNVQTTFSKTIE